MKINYIKISNILSFRYHSNIDEASPIKFNKGVNIVIGENGAGKSTALEVVNFLFKQVFLKHYIFNTDMFANRKIIDENNRRNLVKSTELHAYHSFRLEPNWDTENKPQTIRIEIELDDMDVQNITHLRSQETILENTWELYSSFPKIADFSFKRKYTVDVNLLSQKNKSYTINCIDGEDFGFSYLVNYNFYKQLIEMHNIDNPNQEVDPLNEVFTLIGGYRNYNTFETSILLTKELAPKQLKTINDSSFIKSLNANETTEPPIFKVVRLRVADYHYNLLDEKLSKDEREIRANDLSFIKLINKNLELINLECKIALVDQQSWQYSFEFYDTKRKKILGNINVLSAGQKAIIHLIFEAYGRGFLNGGVIIIDEPEIHLHYQFQHEYMKILNTLNETQNCQYILVTHSEALINSSTIHQVIRFAINDENHTSIYTPTLTQDQKTLIKILDNTKSTYAFFAKKILLVEGDIDRYFFKSVLQLMYPSLDQEIAVLYIDGKGNFDKWYQLFVKFGLKIYSIGDLDCIIEHCYPNERAESLKTLVAVQSFKSRHGDWETNIDNLYPNNIFILKNGDIESYLNIAKKDLSNVISFCNNQLSSFLADNTNPNSLEIKRIIDIVAKG